MGKRKKKYLFMQVTTDELSLPIAVADTAVELAKMRGIKANTIAVSMYKYKNGLIKYPKYIKVKIDETEGE